MRLQSNLTAKENMLASLLGEKERTILEQQRIIRRLLRKSLAEEERSLPASCYSSDSTLYTLPDYDQGKTDTLYETIRLKIRGQFDSDCVDHHFLS